MRPTKWTTADGSWPKIIDNNGLIVAEALVNSWGTATARANAEFITAACNACMEINPDNPMAVAEALPELVRWAKDALVALDFAKTRDPEQAGLYHSPSFRAILAKIEAK
jgi:hypothetical protein